MISKNVSVNMLLLFSCWSTVQAWWVFLEFMQARASSHVPVLQEQNIPGSVNNSYKKDNNLPSVELSCLQIK